MRKRNLNIKRKIYNLYVVIFSLVSISLIILDFLNIINIEKSPYHLLDNVICIMFTIDYVVRFIIAKNKINFFKTNIFDLISIIPFDSIFSFFRITRILRITKISKLTKLIRIIGISGRLCNHVQSFLNTNNFIYIIYLSSILVIISAMIYSCAENVPYLDSLWWAIVTATTVGYGDISPISPMGRFAGIILMFVGIGFVGTLTSTITEYFNKTSISEEKLDILLNKLEKIEESIEELKNKYP